MTETPPKLPVYLAALPQLQTLLRGTDITVTPGVWLGVHDLLLRLDQEGRLPPLARFGDLRALLSPLLCRNPEEQRRFKEIFRDWHIQLQIRQADDFPGPETAEVDSGAALSGKWPRGAALPLEIKEGVAGVERSKPLASRGTRPWQSVVIALGILILAGLLWWGITRSPEEAIENQTETSLTEKSEEKSPQQEKLKTPDTVSTEISDTDASEQGLEPLPPRESPTLDPATHRDLDIIGVLLPWLPFLLALIGLGGYGWQRRRRIARQKRISEAESLYTAPPKGSTPSGYLRLEPPRNDLFGALPVQTALRRLHRPVLYPTRHLDTHATVRESARQAGLFSPVYWERLRVPRLIVLAESRYGADPVTGLGALVVERLRAAGFIVHRYDYRGSPRAVWKIGKKPEESGQRHTLADIAYRYPNSRLLLIGDPTTLLDLWGERVKTWVSEFGIWSERAILGTRQDTSGWKKILGDIGFAVAPLGSNGIEELAAHLSGGDPIDTKDRDTPLPETLRRPPARWLQPIPPNARELARLLRILRRFLGEDGFYLLGALAVYPRLHWGLIRILEYSLFPGVKDDPEPEPFDREARLLRLVQLPWFPRGWLPDWLRKALIHDLDADRRGRINKIYKELIYRKAGHENAPEGIEDVPIGPIVEPPSRGRLAGAVAGVLLLAGVLGAGMWGLWHGTPWWEWNLRSETEGFLLERQIAANGEHSFAIVGDNNHPELAKALRGTLREFGFIEEQGRLELDIEARLVASAGTRHEILLGPNADSEAAEEIARRLAWLTYRQSGTIAKTVFPSIPDGMIVVRLAAEPQTDPGISFVDDDINKELSGIAKEEFYKTALAFRNALAQVKREIPDGSDDTSTVIQKLAESTEKIDFREAAERIPLAFHDSLFELLPKLTNDENPCVPGQTSGVNKKALLIGNDDYQYMSDLRGSLSTAELLDRSLRQRGFETHLLSNATRNQIISGMQQLVEKTQCGDFVFLHFTGRGGKFVAQKHWLPEWSFGLMGVDHGELQQPRAVLGAEISQWITGIRNRQGNIVVSLDISNAAGLSLQRFQKLARRQNYDRSSKKESSANGKPEFISLLKPESGGFAAFYAADSLSSNVPDAVALPPLKEGGSDEFTAPFPYALAKSLQTLKNPSIKELTDAIARNYAEHKKSQRWADPVFEIPNPEMRFGLPSKPPPVGQIFQDRLKDGSLGPKMIVIPSGKFMMGSPKSERKRESYESPQHQVHILKPFALSVTEVTFDDYDRFARATERNLPEDNGWVRSRHPVVNVSWEDAAEYTKWLSSETGKEYRLPTEAEWEYAARAGTTTPFYTGDCIHTDQANYDGNYDYASCDANNSAKTGVYRGKTMPVSSFPTNPWGLHEMYGNVWEWVMDCWHTNYKGAPTDASAWGKENDGNCSWRVVRGGAWKNGPSKLRSAIRYGYSTYEVNNYFGFRIARNLAPSTTTNPIKEPIDPSREQPPQKSAQLIVRSNVSEDVVYIDDLPVGPTGPVSHTLDVGEHTVRVEKEGYETFEVNLTLKPTENKTVKARLIPKEKWVYLGHYLRSSNEWKTKYFNFTDKMTPESLLNQSLTAWGETGTSNVRIGMPTPDGEFREVIDVLKPGRKVVVQEIKEWHSSGYMWARITYVN